MKLVTSIIPILCVAVLWELLCFIGLIDSKLFPPPTATLSALGEWAKSGELIRDLYSSLWRAMVGFLIGSIFGILVGVATGRIAKINRAIGPIIQFLRPLPPVAIIPLIIVWLGIGNEAKIFSIAFAVFFPVWINSHVGSGRVAKEYFWTVKLLGKSRLTTFRDVILPGAFPSIFTGLRTGIGIAVIMVYVAEIAGASSGIGYQISVSHLAYRIDKMMAALLVLGLFGALMDLTLTKLVLRIFPWFRLNS